MKYSKFIDSIRLTSFVDYPNEICAVIYTQGCNMNCTFCYSKHLIPQKEGKMTWEDALAEILKLKHITAVVFSGGEPTMNDLSACILDLHDLGLKVGIQTNGRGEFLPKILSHVDYILLSKYTPETLRLVMDGRKESCIVDLIDVKSP